MLDRCCAQRWSDKHINSPSGATDEGVDSSTVRLVGDARLLYSSSKRQSTPYILLEIVYKYCYLLNDACRLCERAGMRISGLIGLVARANVDVVLLGNL